jgi:phage tail sheath protein FI
MDEPVQILSFADFEREFGGLDSESEASYAINQFFQNGGTEALIIRTAKGAETAAVMLQDKGGADVLKVRAATPGAWGNNLRMDVDYDTPESGRFNLTVAEYDSLGEAPVRVETLRNLSMNSSRFVKDVINEESMLIQVDQDAGNIGPSRPTQTGTTGATDLTTLLKSDGSVDESQIDKTAKVKVEVDEAGRTAKREFTLGSGSNVSTLPRLMRVFQQRLRETGLEALAQAEVESIQNKLRIRAGAEHSRALFSFSDVTGDLAQTLGLRAADATSNVQRYEVGLPSGTDVGSEKGQQKGADGNLPGTDQLKGSRNDKTGLYALEDADLFNILCIPGMAKMADADAMPVLTEAIDYCEGERAFMIVDVPEDTDGVDEIKSWVSNNGNILRGGQADHAALYFPRLNVPDPLNEYRSRTIGASGTLAGLYARTDTDRGVWKAPAGTEATLRGVRSLDYMLSDAENGVLNPLGINALRTFDVRGTVSWGARTLRGADRLADEYKYVPVRRLALFLEESLFRGLQWVVFEPNDEPLWAQIRMNVNEFMQRLFRQGAFQGTSPGEAYFVKCDSETTTQADIDRGIVNIVVGFAPLKPAEFVILKIQQKAGEEA